MRAHWVNQQKANMPGGISCGGTRVYWAPKSKYSGVVDLFKWDGCSFHATYAVLRHLQDDLRHWYGAFVHILTFWVQFGVISCCCLHSGALQAAFRRFCWKAYSISILLRGLCTITAAIFTKLPTGACMEMFEWGGRLSVKEGGHICKISKNVFWSSGSWQ